MNEDEHGPKWFSVRSQPRQEHVAAAHLCRLEDVEIFCPRIRFKRSGRGGGVHYVTEALFPGYFFARFHFERDHRNVRYAHGVTGIVRFGEKYPSVPDAVITDLRAHIGGEAVTEIAATLKEGATVKIVDGAFRGISAVITQFRPAAERVRVLLEFLGRNIEAELPSELVLLESAHPLASHN